MPTNQLRQCGANSQRQIGFTAGRDPPLSIEWPRWNG